MPAQFVPAPNPLDQPTCYGCESRVEPVDLAWHTLYRHGWRKFVDVLLELNTTTDPARFIVAVFAAGAAAAVAALALLAAAVRAALALLT